MESSVKVRCAGGNSVSGHGQLRGAVVEVGGPWSYRVNSVEGCGRKVRDDELHGQFSR
jgi:hypothetical protein